MTACRTYPTERLSAFVDGDLSATDAAAVRGHAATRADSPAARAHAAPCPDCTAALADLRALVANTAGLDAPEPPPTLWPSIAGALDKHEPRGWVSIANWRPFAVGALAGAAVVGLAIVALPVLRGTQRGVPAASPGAEMVATSTATVDPLLHEAE